MSSRRGRKKRKKREVLSGDQGEGIGEALAKETDRGVALVAVEFLNDLLEIYLCDVMAQNGAGDLSNSLVSGGIISPLGSFAWRAKCCRAFGMIGPKTFGALEDLREIRNHCAHQTYVSLKDPALEGNIQSLKQFVYDRGGAHAIVELNEMWREYGADPRTFTRGRRWVANAAHVVNQYLIGHIISERSTDGRQMPLF